ncbi:MAG: hypothetical protein V1899_02785 [Planctomycetota bacterium]
MVASIGAGDAVVASGESLAMAADLELSLQNVKPPTRKIAALTPAQWIEIVQQALHDYRKSGGVVAIRYLPPKYSTAIILSDVYHCESCGNLSVGGKCHYCPDGGNA